MTVWIIKVARGRYRIQVRNEENEIIMHPKLTHNREGARQVARKFAEHFHAKVRWYK